MEESIKEERVRIEKMHEIELKEQEVMQKVTQ